MSAPESAPLPFAAGGKIGRYELTAELATGGMGRVYLARARGPAGFEKLVALKCINPELATEQSFIDMFFDEARIAARIDHPNVCRVFDFGEADGRYFIAMEYLVGEPVTRVARKLSAHGASAEHDEIVAHIVAQAAEGLHAAHELTDEEGKPLQIVHRDISPQNLFVTYDGGVRVVDFGIASAQGRLHRTSTGSIKGKLAYMAPEQMRREPADRRVDVWALGVVLWELVTRKRLFRGGNELELMLAVMNDPIPAPSTVRDAIDPGLEAIVMKALAKDVGDRYRTARELSSALNRWIVARGQVVGIAELAAFMSGMFAAERVARLEFLERARRNAAETAPIVPSTPDEVPERSAMRETRPETPRAARFTSTSPGTSRGPAFAIGAVLLLGIASGVGWFALGGPPAPAIGGSPAAEPEPSSPLHRPPADPVVSPSIGGSTSAPGPVVEAVVEPAIAEPSLDPAPATPAARRERDPRLGAGVESRSAPRPEAVTEGRLRVVTPGGWADVYVEGRRVGRTPLELDLPVGRTSLELRPFGLAPMSGDVAMRRSVTIGERPVELSVPIES